jgi:hypothetical protein
VRFWLQVVAIKDLIANENPVVDRVHRRVGRGWAIPEYCTAWGDLDAGVGPVMDLMDLQEKLSSLADDRDVLVFAGVEVSEKRVRHWVRLPWACGLSLVVAGQVADLREQVAVVAMRERCRGKRSNQVRGIRLAIRGRRADGLLRRHFSGP